MRDLQPAGPTDVHMVQLILCQCVPARMRNQGTVHLGRGPTHQAYWPKYQAMDGMGGVRVEGVNYGMQNHAQRNTDAKNNTKMRVL